MTYAPPDASTVVTAGIVLLSLALLVAWPVLLHRAAAAEPDRRALVAWLAGGLAFWSVLWLAVARAGLLADATSRPPPFVVLPVSMVLGVVWLFRSRVGVLLARSTPMVVLVALQSFRLPLELVMHRAATEGVMPVQMTFGVLHGALGRNYDLVTGATALLLAVALRERPMPRALVLAWNVLGTALLVNVVTVAIASTPVVAAFGTAPSELNTWVLYPPFVWLPAVLVPSALLGHLLVFRKLRDGARGG